MCIYLGVVVESLVLVVIWLLYDFNSTLTQNILYNYIIIVLHIYSEQNTIRLEWCIICVAIMTNPNVYNEQKHIVYTVRTLCVYM